VPLQRNSELVWVRSTGLVSNALRVVGRGPSFPQARFWPIDINETSVPFDYVGA